MKQEPSVDVRERILDAAVRLVETRPEAFTMARVAAEAGLSRATVYRRFGSVAGLRSALCTARGATVSIDRSGHRARVLDAALAEFTRAGPPNRPVEHDESVPLSARAGPLQPRP